MKTRHIGRSVSIPLLTEHSILPAVLPFFDFSSNALKNYRENRENGTDSDNPNNPFPSAGFDKLEIEKTTFKPDGQHNENYWPDSQGRYWWNLALQDGCVTEDFYWMKDKVRGWPDENDNNRYWFTVHHALTGDKIEGFSQKPDYKKGFPDNKGKYWVCIQFTDAYCPAIQQWIEKKDRNFQIRTIRTLMRILYQPTKTHSEFNLFTALPVELQLMIFEFVVGGKLSLDIFNKAKYFLSPKKIIEESLVCIHDEETKPPENLGNDSLKMVHYDQLQSEDSSVFFNQTPSHGKKINLDLTIDAEQPISDNSQLKSSSSSSQHHPSFFKTTTLQADDKKRKQEVVEYESTTNDDKRRKTDETPNKGTKKIPP